MSNALPTSHPASLDNLCSAFLGNGVPPPPTNRAAYDTLNQRVEQWADPLSPSIPSHVSDHWTFTVQDVKRQCTMQHTNSAPGPDALLPVLLKYAGDSTWAAMAAIYTFSWQHSVLPQAWREANVMALYKGDGNKSDAGSYRPISMTSIIIRTLEHLIHHRLTADLDQRNFFSATQFGFRKQHRTEDAILFLISGLQRWMRTADSRKRAQQCPVLFLDISKAFDRVDHSILMQRIHDAGVSGIHRLLRRAVRAGKLSWNLQVWCCKPDPLGAHIVHVREDRRNSAGFAFAGRFRFPGSRIKMFDQNLVDPIIDGKDLDCGAAELTLNLGLTHGHGSILLDT